MVQLRPYPEYKDSGVPWLGEVPAHWEVRPAVAAYRPKSVRNTGMAEKTVLSLSYGRIVVKAADKLHGLVPESFETYQIVEPGDIVVRTTDLQNDRTSLRIGSARDRGIITSAYLCLATTERVLPAWGYQLLNAYDMLKIIYGFGSGLRQNLDFGDIKRMPVVIPPAEEQIQIVRFLDHADRRIGRYVRAKQKVTKLLDEQKRAIIERAVTRGVSPTVELEPTGAEWLPEMPGHWKGARLKFVATQIVDCLHATPTYSDGGRYPAIRTADVRPGRVLIEKARRVDDDTYGRWTARMAPAEGDILYSREGERFVIAALVPAGIRLCVSQRMMVFRIHPSHNPAYVMWQINCRHVYAQAAADLIGAAAPHVNVERIKNFWLALPPRSEQDAIVAALASETSALDAAILDAERQTALVREFRRRLIADVVTGKVEVQSGAAVLAEEIPDLPAADDGTYDEDIATDDELDAEMEGAEA